MAPLHDELLTALVEHNEPLCIPGLPTLRLVERRTGRLWDVKALADREPQEFQRLLELGCLTVNDKVAEAQVHAGNFSGIHRTYSWATHASALVFDWT